jgi:hypothetical protein
MVKKSVRSIVGAVDAAAARWSDSAFAPRVRAREAVRARTGYSLPVVEYAFDRLFESLRRDAVEAVIADELGSLDVLDGFVPRFGRPPTYALPLGRICVVASRSTIGVAIVPAIFALCAKCDVLVKDREDHLVAAFFETLSGELEALGDAATARAWQGNGDAVDLARFDAVVAFGSDETLARIARSLPISTRLIPFGSKASAGYVTCEALCDEVAARRIASAAAHDLILYESEGCLSLHALFVEEGGAISAQGFATMLVDAMRAAATQFPPRAEASDRARLAMERDLAIFRGTQPVQCDPQASYLAVLDPPIEEPPLFAPRAIGIHRVQDCSQAAQYLERHGIELEAVAVAGSPDDVLELAWRTKAARIASFGTLQAPSLGGFHGGRPRIAEFVRWMTAQT